MNDHILNKLQEFFSTQTVIELAVLIGSRATGRVHAHSDWDFAVQWRKDIPYLDSLGKTEELRSRLSALLSENGIKIDIVDIPTARLAMRSVIAQEGKLLKGENELAWSRFLLRTWRDLEDFYWEQTHAT